MQTQVTFLTGYKPLVKTYSPTGVEPFPLIKNVTSHPHSVEQTDLQTRIDLYRQYAKHGGVLMKGASDRPLVKESRSGHFNNDIKTTSIIIDADDVGFDGFEITPPLDSNTLTAFAEKVVRELPDVFQDISYIAHASSSMGLDSEKGSLHLEFQLKKAVHPRALRNFLIFLNFSSETFKEQLTLTKSQTSLHFIVDPCLADNSRMLMLSTPVFEDVENPFLDDEDRWTIVEKGPSTLDIAPILRTIDAKKLHKMVAKQVDELRAETGMPAYKKKGVKQTILGQPVWVVTNPDALHMEIHRDQGNYVTYNVGTGTNHAFYVQKNSPSIVRSFKGDEPFLFEVANSTVYAAHIRLFGYGEAEVDETGNVRKVPLVFRERTQDKTYSGMFNPDEAIFEELDLTADHHLEQFMTGKGSVMPVQIPQMRMRFDPQDNRTVDFNEGFINKFQLPPMLKHLVPIDDHLKDINALDLPGTLQEVCPATYKIILSAVGDERNEIGYFLNWLGFILQTRKHSGTAWLLHGCQGTGKGLLWNDIIVPIMDRKYCHHQKLDNLDEKFDGWIETKIFSCVDEFRLHDSKQAGKLFNKLKMYISEPTNTMRAMYKEAVNINLFCNFLFYSNENDPLRLPEDDRRFNIGVRQATSLKQAYGEEEVGQLVIQIREELSVFASVMMHAVCSEDMARTPMDNPAKRALREASADSVDQFVSALKDGDLGFFESVMDDNAGANYDYQLSARNLFRAWLRDYQNGEACRVFVSEIKPFYNLLIGKQDHDTKISQMLGHRGLNPTSIRRGGRQRKGLSIDWNHDNIDTLVDLYLNDTQINIKAAKDRVFNSPE